jgi:Holliday junction DNA helicase RuvA
MVVREDAQLLYGFYQEHERALFRALIKVNGVGPKLALTILSGMEPDTFVRCVNNNNAGALVSIPGIGKKTAERLIVEMRDALSKWSISAHQQTDTPITPTADHALQEAISALIALGYKPNEAQRAISNIHAAEHSSEHLIRLALKSMVKEV